MIKVLTQFIHNLSGWHQDRSLYLLPLVLSWPRKDDQEDDFLAISQWILVTCASNWHLQRHIALAKVTERDYESMIMAVVLFILFWLRLVRIDGFSSLTSQSLTLPDIDRKLIMNLHASATIYLLIIDPIEDLQLLILLPRLIAMMSSWSCFLNPLFYGRMIKLLLLIIVSVIPIRWRKDRHFLILLESCASFQSEWHSP